MDITALVAFLAPYLPYLIKLGEKASEKLAEEAGAGLATKAGQMARALWQKLRPKMAEKPSAQEAAEDVARAPDDADAVAALRLQLKKLLAEDQTLANEITQLWQQAKAENITVTASGKRSVAIGRDISRSTIITGDKNK